MSWPWEYFQQCMIWMSDQKACADQTVEYVLQNVAIVTILVVVDLLVITILIHGFRQARRKEITE
jgi:hypothetical protein